MVEPVTANIAFTTPNTGDLPGAWGTASNNPNFVVVDGFVGGFVVISMSIGIVTATGPTNAVAPAAGPYQAANNLITLSGTLTGTATLVLPTPGRWVVKNSCINSLTWPVILKAANFTGNATQIGAIPGKAITVYSDSVSMDYVDMPDIGAIMAFPGYTTYQPWMTCCTNLPWLACNGASYSTSVYPGLFSLLAYRYGGSGVNFNVPSIAADSGGGLTFIKAG